MLITFLKTCNIIKFYFSAISISVIFLGILINFYEKYLPGFILKTFRCGKHGFKGTTNLPIIEFPKSSFKQFYQVGVIFMVFAYMLLCSTYIFGIEVPNFVTELIQSLTRSTNNNSSSLSATQVFIASSLIALQIGRRYYDTHYVSVFGQNSKINLTHWGVGMTYYPMLIVSVLCEAPNFSTKGVEVVKFSDIGYFEIFGVSLFMWSWWHQHKCTVILANLRRNKKDDYKIPMGDWFDYVSSPHCNAEILMYVALTFFLWKNTAWWYVMLWIFGNQIESILLSHWWYQESFVHFPKNRKALIPLIY